MSVPKELITDIENREKLMAFSDVLSKPDWKKFDMRLAKAQSDYLKGAHLNSRDALKKYMQEIVNARHDFSLMVRAKYDRLGDLLISLGVENIIDTSSAEPLRWQEDSDEDANNAEEADEEEPEPPQPVHVPAKPPVSSPMRNILKNMNIKGGAK